MLRFLTSGESHGKALTAVLDGFPAGVPLSIIEIDRDLLRRQQGYGSGARMKIEQDSVQVLGGIMGGVTTGAPLAFQVDNLDYANWKDREIEPLTIPRPGHADLTGAIKYGYKDLRPALERASARETTMRVVVGSVCKQFLAPLSIIVGAYVSSIDSIKAEFENLSFDMRYKLSEENDMRCPDPEATVRMRARIDEARVQKDTLGGILDVFALGVPPGLGTYSQWDRRLDARLGAALLSIQAIKGVEVGEAWSNAHSSGIHVQDPIRLNGLSITRFTNNAGGIEGGISNGEPIVLHVAMKPIATTLTPQSTIDLATGKETLSKYERSDFCPVPRAVPVLEAMVAFVLADEVILKLGGDSLDEMMPRFKNLKKGNIKDLRMDNLKHVWWE